MSTAKSGDGARSCTRFWMTRNNAWRRCKAKSGVREVRRSTTTSNGSGFGLPATASRGGIPALACNRGPGRWAERRASGAGRALVGAGSCGLGQTRERESERDTGPAGKRKGPRIGLNCWVGFGFGLGWVLFYFSFFSPLTQTKLKRNEFKFKFEFNPNTQTNKTMHQHECNKHF